MDSNKCIKPSSLIVQHPVHGILISEMWNTLCKLLIKTITPVLKVLTCIITACPIGLSVILAGMSVSTIITAINRCIWVTHILTCPFALVTRRTDYIDICFLLWVPFIFIYYFFLGWMSFSTGLWWLLHLNNYKL